MLVVLKYWRKILIALAVCIVIGLGLYVKHVFADRDRLDRENALLKKDLESAVKIQQMTNQITEAIRQIKIRSSVNVTRIETTPKPAFVDSAPVMLIPGGLLQAVYSSAATARTTPAAAAGRSVAAKQSAGGILPH